MKIDWTFTLDQPWTLDRVLNFVTMANQYTSQIYLDVLHTMYSRSS